MENKIFYVQKDDLEKIDLKDFFVIEIDGLKITNWQEYTNDISLKLEIQNIFDYDNYVLAMNHLVSKNLCIVIYDFNVFLKDSPSFKKSILENFESNNVRVYALNYEDIPKKFSIKTFFVKIIFLLLHTGH